MSLRRRRPPQYLELTTTKNGTFAASIVRISGAPDCVWRFEDGEEQVGDSCSKAMDGHEQKVVLKIAPKWIFHTVSTSMDLVAQRNFGKCGLEYFDFYGNFLLNLELADIPISAYDIHLGECQSVVGLLSDIGKSVQTISLYNCHRVGGDIADLPATIKNCYLSGCAVGGTRLHHLTGLILLWLDGQSATQARVDAIILDIWQHRASFTYAGGITCNLDGNNAAPSGTSSEPPEDGVTNSDWQWDADLGHHIPLTGYAMVFVLTVDPFSEGFNIWSITVS